MDFIKYLTVLVVFCFGDGESGGHGGKHHDHVRIHMPEFVHHDHHTKVITIHHHHHKPKKEHHHHHHHHHHKPHVTHHVPNYHHHHKKLHVTTKTVSKGHGHSHHGHGHHHGSHGHHSHTSHHGHHGHHGHYGHHGHHHHDPVSYDPPVSYDSPSTTFEEDFGSSFTPSAPVYGGIVAQAPQYHGITPQVHGVRHTVKQVKVFDSLPGAIPGNINVDPSHGYEVTEADDDDDDSFSAVNSLQQTYPATFSFVRGADAPTLDSFSQLSPQTSVQTHDPFATAPEPTSALGDVESFTGGGQQTAFASLAPTHSVGIPVSVSAEPSAEYPVTYPEDQTGFDSPQNSFIGSTGETALLSNDDNSISEETPVSFSRAGGIQQIIKTGGIETVVY